MNRPRFLLAAAAALGAAALHRSNASAVTARPDFDVALFTEDVCLAGEPAINGVCGDLLCVCAPTLDPGVTRVRRYDGRTGDGDEHAIFIVLADRDLEMDVIPAAQRIGALRVSKEGWSLVDPIPAAA